MKVDLHLWVLICLFLGNILVMHSTLGMAALAFDGIRNGQLNCILDIKYG
jgi:hypothetical protein